MKKLHLKIDGMSCSGCVNRVRTALEKTGATQILSADVGSAEIEFDENTTTPRQFIDALHALGFEVTQTGAPA